MRCQGITTGLVTSEREQIKPIPSPNRINGAGAGGRALPLESARGLPASSIFNSQAAFRGFATVCGLPPENVGQH